MTALVLCAHGTDNVAGRAAVIDLRDAVAQAAPAVDVHDAYVDVQEPSLDDVMTRLAHETVVVVPLLFCTGYHVQVDVARAVGAHPDATATGALGPHDHLTTLLARRLTQAGARPGEPVILAAAGSSRRRATEDALGAAARLQDAWGGPVTAAYGSAASPRVTEVVSERRRAGERTVVASYLLGRGFFHDKLLATGADVVTEPLGADPLVVSTVLDRFETAYRERGRRGTAGR